MRNELNNILICKNWIEELNIEISQLEEKKQKIESKIRSLKNLRRGQKISLRCSLKKCNMQKIISV